MSTLFWYVRTLIKLTLGRGVFTSYSQYGEDIVVRAQIRWIKKGVYVDVGCADPVLYSTTYHFYKLGWCGLVIDPNPSFAGRYAILRPRDRFINAGVAKKEARLRYHTFNDETYNTFSPEDAEHYLATSPHLRTKSVRPVLVRPLADIVREQGIEHIDYLNIDAQGFDLQVLESHDWSIRPTVVSVEDEFFNPESPNKSAIYCFLTERGYTLKAYCNLTLIFK